MYSPNDARLRVVYYDQRSDIDFTQEMPLKIVLPHSCEEWVIGGVKEAQDLIADLQRLIKELQP